MKKIFSGNSVTKLIAAVMVIMVAVTFMPLIEGGAASAAVSKAEQTTNVKSKKPAAVKNDMPDSKDLKSLFSMKNIGAGGEYCKVTTSSKCVASIKGKVGGGDVFAGVYIDNFYDSSMILGPKSSGMLKPTIDVKISLKNYSVGFHTLYVVTTDRAKGDGQFRWFEVNDVLRNITDKPNYKGSFDVYSKYANYYPYSSMWTNTEYPLFIEYKGKKQKKWKRYGPMKSNAVQLYSSQGFKVKGFKANKKYKTRIRYGQYENTSKNKTILNLGPVKKTASIKTGKAKKPAVKSIGVKAVNVRFHKVKHPGYWNYVGGYAFWHPPYTEKFYTTNIKITVKLKKKPGAKGIMINGKRRKGNKKTYTYKYRPYPNYFVKRPPKGMKKYTVRVWSYQSSKYGGYSPIYKTKKKIR